MGGYRWDLEGVVVSVVGGVAVFLPGGQRRGGVAGVSVGQVWAFGHVGLGCRLADGPRGAVVAVDGNKWHLVGAGGGVCGGGLVYVIVLTISSHAETEVAYRTASYCGESR